MQSKKNSSRCFEQKICSKVKISKMGMPSELQCCKNAVSLCRNGKPNQNYGQNTVVSAQSIAMQVVLLQGMVNSMVIQCLILTTPEHRSEGPVTQLPPLKFEIHSG